MHQYRKRKYLYHCLSRHVDLSRLVEIEICTNVNLIQWQCHYDAFRLLPWVDMVAAAARGAGSVAKNFAMTSHDSWTTPFSPRPFAVSTIHAIPSSTSKLVMILRRLLRYFHLSWSFSTGTTAQAQISHRWISHIHQRKGGYHSHQPKSNSCGVGVVVRRRACCGFCLLSPPRIMFFEMYCCC